MGLISKQQWIPVSSGLPDEAGFYRVTYISLIIPHPLIRGTKADYYGKRLVGVAEYDGKDWCCFGGKVVAWAQPRLLTEPYEEE